MNPRGDVTKADDDEVMCEHHARNIHEFVAAQPAPDVKLRDLAEALYAVSERGLWPDDIDSVSSKQALYVWRVVEHVRKHGFPKHLRM